MVLKSGVGQLNHLNRLCLNTAEIERFEKNNNRPIKILQIGEGNFLRGFFDWMIHECHKQDLFDGSIVLTQPRPTGKTKLKKLKDQDGLYTLMLRGLKDGVEEEQKEVISVFSNIIDPYSEWSRFMAMAKNPTLEFVVSNTTEAGLSYQAIDLEPGKPIQSYPGKLAALLYERFQYFDGDPEKGLIILPCELVEENGGVLKQIVLQCCWDWELPEPFIHWVENHNRFLNTLVDRIVTGYPDQDQAAEWFSEWDYEDEMLSTAEPYHLWAIEAEEELDHKLPLQRAGLNVHWVDDLTPFQMRKVRILNGAHTVMAPLGVLSGLDEVKEVIEHPNFGSFVNKTIEEEIVPSIPYNRKEMTDYSDSVIERFKNPFIRHLLIDITLNSLSKFKVRLIPTLEAYYNRHEKLPENIVHAFAGLVRFYKVRKKENDYIGERLNGEQYFVKDDVQALGFFEKQWLGLEEKAYSLDQMIEQILSNKSLWGKDLTEIPGLSQLMCLNIAEIERGSIPKGGIQQ
jgi:tagaturonate reductase